MRGLSAIAELLVCMTVTQTDTLSDDCITNDSAAFRAQFVFNCLCILLGIFDISCCRSAVKFPA